MLLLAHGGAGERRPARKALGKLEEALSAGYRVLTEGGKALDSVIETIVVLEDSGIFNAGAGGNLQLDGVRRLDASLMEGSALKAGSVIGLEGIRNPIRAARLVMDSPHVMLTNIGAGKIAVAHGLASLPPPDDASVERLIKTRRTEDEAVRLYGEYFSTVGAVALDDHGTLAAGASTGGIRAMLPGRVGDTPMIGAGVYAENRAGAVSCTGTGEFIIRLSLAKEICTSLGKVSPLRAARFSMRRLSKIGGSAGVLVTDGEGRFTITHSTTYMAAGYVNAKGLFVGEKWRR